ncbi:hypothetical protein HanRHA438_Chr11g0492381 [Helianthus annuus]|uniref:Uncharacterized protein n=1 Tax=Helianthus annuus TaxID=4232 RepID=A0A251TAK5_HELAN|nr:hypothetical protein HanXRQr2_Chr11g0479091 [Helianthus annuus]KAJ0500738.1 hypothetical protein HanHA300_Chr11g0392761 [Helianthus annuus]KAJ0508338.1 hypothetical protein HanIR_Chr11g0516121 [Helianthus annuus]KAJ0516612.1 hypothetical protein HanHA89_Chr11g0415761 [Helianthus annuus]KAJ0688558.1 hypothetical protein HanOQP8_Chr11g0395621 [Helianthus annuus]
MVLYVCTVIFRFGLLIGWFGRSSVKSENPNVSSLFSFYSPNTERESGKKGSEHTLVALLAVMGGGFYPDGDDDGRWWWFEQAVIGKKWRSEWRWLREEFAAVVFERGGGERWWSNRMWAGPR